VIQCVLRGFDVVYAPLISSYGSATATLEASPGTEVSLFVTYLTPPLQQRMHETEGAYNLVRLDGVQLMEGVALRCVFKYGAACEASMASQHKERTACKHALWKFGSSLWCVCGGGRAPRPSIRTRLLGWAARVSSAVHSLFRGGLHEALTAIPQDLTCNLPTACVYVQQSLRVYAVQGWCPACVCAVECVPV
jgi:hypothetical protein